MRRSRKRAALLVSCPALVVVVLALLPVSGSAHPERTTVFPEPATGSVPALRSTGPSVVVCKADSRRRLVRSFRAEARRITRAIRSPRAERQALRRNDRLRKSRLRTLRRCRYRHIQAGINAAKSGYRVLIMPGVYHEEPSRAVPVGTPGSEPCADHYTDNEESVRGAPPPAGPLSNDPTFRADRNYQRLCPTSKNLIAVIGDTRPDPDPLQPLPVQCVQLCNLQIRGLGLGPGDVLISSDRLKLDVLRGDRAHGLVIDNLTVEGGAFNGIDLVETDGFRISNVVARYNQNYGVLTFAGINGLYDSIEAYGNGDAGVYPGSNAKGCRIPRNDYGLCAQRAGNRNPFDGRTDGCEFYTTELRNIDSHHNLQGMSGTAGNSTWVHHSDFHDNGTGLSDDSFAAGHPGMPQECNKWENNRIHHNNENYYTEKNTDYCNATPFAQRDEKVVCPQFLAMVGVGLFYGGGNRNLVRDNHIYANYRRGMMLFWVPATLRGENDPARQSDTSNGNRFVDNKLGMDLRGEPAPNGIDIWWDEQGIGNCFSGNATKSSRSGRVVTNGIELPECPNAGGSPTSNPLSSAELVGCTAWDPRDNPRPIGCDWFLPVEEAPQKP